MIAFFDTETTGMVNWDLFPDDPKQPRVIQVAAILTDDKGEIVEEYKSLIKCLAPMHPKAQAAHGYTTQMLIEQGKEVKEVFNKWHSMMVAADLWVAHNIKFDLLMYRIEQHHMGVTVEPKMSFCTMLSTTKLCRLPGKFGYKWPKLEEAYRIICGKKLEGAHDALNDVKACKEIYYKLRGS